MSSGKPNDGAEEPVTVTDKRRIDPETGEVRSDAAGADRQQGSAPAAGSAQESASPELDERVAELTADLQRVQADFANYRKRALRDLDAAAERGKAAVVTELLAILDDLDRARDHGDLESGPLKAVADKLTSALTSLGLAPFGTEGDEFDPVLHEAVQHDGEGSYSVIGNVLRLGYKLGEQVLRHAMVGVVDGDGPAAAAGAGSAESANQAAGAGEDE